MIRSVMDGRAVLTNYTSDMATASKANVQTLLKVRHSILHLLTSLCRDQGARNRPPICLALERPNRL